MSHRGYAIFAGSVMLGVSGVITAAPATDPMETCSQLTDAGARLGCFDQEMRRRHGMGAPPPVSSVAMPGPAPVVTPPAAVPTPAAQPAKAAEDSAPVTAATDVDANFGLQGPELRRKLRAEQGAEKPSPPKILTAQVVRSRASPDHRFTFVLDNGQTWEQTETRAGFYLDPHQTVAISAGALGSFFMETSKQEFVRVRRLN